MVNSYPSKTSLVTQSKTNREQVYGYPIDKTNQVYSYPIAKTGLQVDSNPILKTSLVTCDLPKHQVFDNPLARNQLGFDSPLSQINQPVASYPASSLTIEKTTIPVTSYPAIEKLPLSVSSDPIIQKLPISVDSNPNKLSNLILHRRLGHIGSIALNKLNSSTTSLDIQSPIASSLFNNCSTCALSKLTRKKGKSKLSIGSKYLDILYLDICGPISPSTNRGFKWILCIIDSYSRYSFTYLLSNKSEVYNTLIEFIRREENISNNSIKRIHSDNGREFKNSNIQQFLDRKGIEYTYSSPYAHEQNGLVEIYNRTLLSKVRALLIDSKSPRFLWGEAIEASTYLYNRTPHSSLDFKTPYESRFGEKPNISNIRIWGSRCYRKDYNPSSKLSPRSLLGILVGFGSKGYKVYDIESRLIT